jgi:hypothetical protein
LARSNNLVKAGSLTNCKKSSFFELQQRIKAFFNIRVTPVRAFSVFCILHLIVWVILPLLIRSQVLIDSAEGLAWGFQWQLGYYKHPFLAPWITALFVKVFRGVDLPIYLASQLSVIICFWAVWRLARKILPPWQALLSVILLEANTYYNVIALQFNPNILMLPIWALSALVFYNAISSNKMRWWMLTGLCLGLAFNTKYEAPLLAASMFVFMLWNKQSWRLFKSIGPYIAGLVCLVIFLPNIIWLFKHNLLAIRYGYDNLIPTVQTGNLIWAHVQPVFKFLVSQLGTILPVFFCFFSFYFFSNFSINIKAISKSNWKFLISIGLGPLCFALLYSLLTKAELKGYWSYPFYSFFGVLLVSFLRPAITRNSFKKFLICIGSFQALILVVFTIYIYKSNAYENKIPYKTIAKEVTQQWHSRYNRPLPNVLGTRPTMAYITTYSSDHPTPYFGLNSNDSPWTNDEKIKEQGGIIVWDNGQIPAMLFKRFPRLTQVTTERYHTQTYSMHHQTYHIQVAFIPPESQKK